MTLNDIVQATAAALKAVWPLRKVYADAIPQNADGSFYVGLSDATQIRGLDRQQRRTVGVEVRYFLQERDTLAYLEWAESMFDHFRTMELGGHLVHLTNQTARKDEENRYYQFLFDVDIHYVEAPAESEPMTNLNIEEVVQ